MKDVLKEGMSERSAFYRCLRKYPEIDGQTARFGYLLVNETIRRLNLIDRVITEISGEDFKRINLDTLIFLRLFFYWSRFKERRVENHGKFLKEGMLLSKDNEYKMANEILLRLYHFNYEKFLIGLKYSERLSLENFHSEWFTDYCFRLFGKVFSIKLLKANNKPKPSYIRVNTLMADETNIVDLLKREDVKLISLKDIKYVYQLKKTKKPITKLKAYRKGLLIAQDKSSCLVAHAMNPLPGETVLDVCAAPGGKTSLLAQLMNNKGRILSVDSSDLRMKVWRKEIKRLGVRIANPVVGDALKPPIHDKVDCVLIDPPCTGTGTFSTFPSMKWKINPRTIKFYSKLQQNILEGCSSLVKLQGNLVYSTCSITIEENEQVIERFLLLHPNFELIEACPNIGSPPLSEHLGPKRFYPHLDGSYGFFVAKLRRIN
ncbi:MAG: RsmB/NOP family class I SAM-dependent RNA methyltransferase [Candidatus Hodarchaeota archaeon]